jgi:hypothetical protein
VRSWINTPFNVLADRFYSTSIGYVEFRTIDLVEKALGLSGTVVMGLPIMVQLTESERNKLHPGDGYVFVEILFVYLTSCAGASIFRLALHLPMVQCSEPFFSLT